MAAHERKDPRKFMQKEATLRLEDKQLLFDSLMRQPEAFPQALKRDLS
jgi:hypothetical protein